MTAAVGLLHVPTARGRDARPARGARRPVLGRHARRRALVAVAVVGVVVGGTVVGVEVARADATGASAEQVSTALADLARAQEAYRDAHGRYAATSAALLTTGWRPSAGVDVRVVAAGAGTFCVAAGPDGAGPTDWLTQDWVQTTTACG